MKSIFKLLIFFFIGILFWSCDLLDQKNNSTQDKFKYLTDNDTSGYLLREEEFWKIIEQSRVGSLGNYQLQIKSLKTILNKLDSRQIEKFDNTFTAIMAASYDWKLWGAAYVINGGCSDDCFEYFRQYVIAHGKDKFYQTYKDPESCADWIKSEEVDDWEGIQYAAMDVFKLKTGKDIPKTYVIPYKLKGKPFNEETVSNEYPKLAEKFAGSME